MQYQPKEELTKRSINFTIQLFYIKKIYIQLVYKEIEFE